MSGPLPFALAGIAILCAMDAVIKHLSMTLAVPAVVCLSFWGRAPFAWGWWRARGAKPFDRAMLRFHAVRGVIVAAATLGFFVGLARLPLAEAVTLSFVAPLTIPFVAWALLGERPRRTSLFALGLGFAGVLVAVGGAEAAAPGSRRFEGVVATLVGAALFAVSLVLLRARAGRDGPARVNLLGSVFPALALTPVALVVGDAPVLADWPWLVAAGALGAAGMALYATAYGRAQAQMLAPVEYTALGWAALLGWAVFAEEPPLRLFAGATIIIAAALWAGWDERRLRLAAPPPA